MDKNSVAVVTGANSGIGKATCIELARMGALVVMVCRNEIRGQQALEEVRESSSSNSVYLMICDLGSQQSIVDFCTEFKKRFDRLDVLVNNAGVIVPGRHQTRDGFELQFGVNHLGHFLLTNKLLDVIVKSAPARIVNVASGAHKAGKIHFDDINLEKNYTLWRAYSQSKLANILFTYELAERLKDVKVSVNCLHPGAVATSMGVNRDTGFGKRITGLLKPFFQTPNKGAETVLYLATSDEVEGVTGKYFYHKRAIPSSTRSYNKNDSKRLWELSRSLTGTDWFSSNE